MGRRFRQRGFVLMDVIFGLILIGVLVTVAAVAVDRTGRVERRMADARAATRAAERVLVEMETGAAPPAGAGEENQASVKVRRVEGEAGERVWVRVEATVNGRPAVLVGLVPAAAADAAATKYGGQP